MEFVEPKVERLWITPEPLKVIERAGRICYKSESKITDESAEKFVKMLLDRGHESVLEHGVACYIITCNRGVTHELVRHRIASYSQESTRYCNYQGGVAFGQPDFKLNADDIKLLNDIEQHYKKLIGKGYKPQEARYFLPIGTKTEIAVTMNFREWRHVLKLRTSLAAHPDIRNIMRMVLDDLKDNVPVVFDDIIIKGCPGE